MGGCTLFLPQEEAYLKSVRDHATQDEVREHLGPPTRVPALSNGIETWIYEIRYEQPGNYLAPTGMWCDEYLLSFDNGKVLRNYTKRSEFHGGELMPTTCVTGDRTKGGS
jgi:outer membrane protein assembly factor BamE (lipoprotein component of BamABCDE complex)